MLAENKRGELAVFSSEISGKFKPKGFQNSHMCVTEARAII